MPTLFDPHGNEIPKAPVMGEVASSARDDVAAGWAGDLAAHTDDVLKRGAAGFEVHRKTLADWQVHTTLQQRRNAIIAKEWEVLPGGTRRADRVAAAFMEEQLEHLKWQSATQKMHYGVFYGYAVAELLYGVDGSTVFVDEARVRDRSRFRFGKRDRWLRLTSPGDPSGEPMPPRKFWWFTTGGDHDDELYGVGLAHFLYWPVLFKRKVVQFDLTFLERWAQPVPIGKYPPGTPVPEQKKFLAALAAMRTDAAMVFPQGHEVDQFEALRTGSGSYEPMLDRLDGAIAKVVLSQTMTTDDGSSRSQAEVHQDVADAVIEADASLIDESFTRHPARWLTQWNYPAAEPPIIRRKLRDDEDLSDVADRDQKLFQAGWRRTQESQDQVYGEGYEPAAAAPVSAEGEEAPASGGLRLVRSDAAGGGGAALAAADAGGEEADSAAEVAAGARTALAEALGGLLAPVRAAVEEAATLEALAERLEGIYGDLDKGRFAEVVERTLLLAELRGRSDVLDRL